MSSDDVAISVRGLGKSYTISHEGPGHSTLAETLLHRARHPFRRRASQETFWALKDVDFDLRNGDVVGIIGRNGAGKSTLLKILSRITELTEGRIAVYGRIGSLLEVGTGFHPELTGRENIFLNGAILGMRKKEIARQFDAIVDFAGVEKFLDTPVKRYSSGMYVRLAFAVAAHLESEILIVDEVLAVGDAEFQRRCLGKMKDVASSGRAVLFVSHHMQSVQVLCNRGMYLEHGQVRHYGSVAGAIECYTASFARTSRAAGDPERRPGSGEFRFSRVVPAQETFTGARGQRDRRGHGAVRFAHRRGVVRGRPGIPRAIRLPHPVAEAGALPGGDVHLQRRDHGPLRGGLPTGGDSAAALPGGGQRGSDRQRPRLQ